MEAKSPFFPAQCIRIYQNKKGRKGKGALEERKEEEEIPQFHIQTRSLCEQKSRKAVLSYPRCGQRGLKKGERERERAKEKRKRGT